MSDLTGLSCKLMVGHNLVDLAVASRPCDEKLVMVGVSDAGSAISEMCLHLMCY